MGGRKVLKTRQHGSNPLWLYCVIFNCCGERQTAKQELDRVTISEWVNSHVTLGGALLDNIVLLLGLRACLGGWCPVQRPGVNAMANRFLCGAPNSGFRGWPSMAVSKPSLWLSHHVYKTRALQDLGCLIAPVWFINMFFRPGKYCSLWPSHWRILRV